MRGSACCINQFCGLERSAGRGGARDNIDHKPHAHDDISNSVAGLISVLLAGPGRYNVDALADVNYGDLNPIEFYRKNRLRCPPSMTPEQFEKISQPVAAPLPFR